LIDIELKIKFEFFFSNESDERINSSDIWPFEGECCPLSFWFSFLDKQFVDIHDENFVLDHSRNIV
jgi:hypothetical protein